MLNFVKRLLKLQRTVMMVDYENRVQYYKTYDYPDSPALLLMKDNRTIMLPIRNFTKSKDVYHLDTERGLYILKYVW